MCKIDEFEIRRHQTSYSIDTALHLSNKYPGAELCWIIGADHIGKLSQWKQIEKLGKIISFICAVRNGYDTDETLIPQGVKLEFIDFAPLPYSSTEIRNRLKNGLDCDLMLDPSVKKYTIADSPHYSDLNRCSVLRINGNLKSQYTRVLIRKIKK